MIDALKQKIKNLTSDKKFSEILTGSVYVIAARVVATGLTLVSSVIVARIYGAEAMGTLAVVNSFLIIVTIFTVLGTNTSILRFIPEHIVKHSVTSAFRIYRKIQYFVAGISVGTGFLFFFMSPFVAAKIFSKPHLSYFFALSACFVVFRSLMELNTQAVRGLRLMRAFVFMQVVPSLSMLAILIGGTFLYHNLDLPVYAQLAAYGISAVIGAWLMDRAFKNRMRIGDEVKPVKMREILDISLPMLMTSSMQFFVGQSGVMMLAIFRTEREVGLYYVADKLSTLTAFVMLAINTMVAPKFAELYHLGKMDELIHVARKASKLIFWTTTPILLILVLFGKPILGVFYGQDYTAAYLPMILMIIGQFVNAISGPTNNFLNMIGHQKVFRNIIFSAALINIVISLVLIPRYGMNGAAIGGMLSLCFWNGYTLFYIKGKFGRMIGYFPAIRA